MANDMSGAFIKFDEASNLDKLLALPMPKDVQLYYFPATGKIGKMVEHKEVTYTTTLDLSNWDVKPVDTYIDKEKIYETMRALMEHQERMLYDRRERERRAPTVKAYEILRTPDHWIQKSVYQQRHGLMAYCILGALMCKWGITDMNYPHYGFDRDVAIVARAILSKFPSVESRRDLKSVIAYWNDDPQRQFKEVQEVLREADV